MIAKELRIGNYVWDDYGGVMIIHQISNDLVDCKKENHLPSGRYDLKSINPIVIDGNWLLKFGFSKIGYQYYEIWNIKFCTCDFGWLVIFKGEDVREIKYIHELQNIFIALTGHELLTKTH